MKEELSKSEPWLNVVAQIVVIGFSDVFHHCGRNHKFKYAQTFDRSCSSTNSKRKTFGHILLENRWEIVWRRNARPLKIVKKLFYLENKLEVREEEAVEKSKTWKQTSACHVE